MATIQVFWLAVGCLLVVLWMQHRIFTGIANLVAAGFSWGLIKGATLVRHPFDPLGTSNSGTYQLLYGLMVGVLLLFGWLLMRLVNEWSIHPTGGTASDN